MKTPLLKLAVLVIVVFSGCNQLKKTSSEENIKKILPPVPGVNIAFSKYNVNAKKGGIIKHLSGTLIKVPTDAFVDKDDKPVDGNVEIDYREMHSLGEVFVSGIPMAYDSAGTEYHFETAGMNEIRAFKNGDPVFINKNKTIDICLKSNSTDEKFNLYYFDTIQHQWLNKGKDVPVSIDDSKIDEPVKPVLASDDKTSFSIKVDYNEFPELKVFENTKFQLTDSSIIDPEYSQTLWTDVKIEKGEKKGIYKILFRKYDNKAEYEVMQVCDKKDSAKAFAYYEDKFETYKTALLAEIEKEKKLIEERKITEQKEMNSILEKYKKEDDEQKKLELQQELNNMKMDTFLKQQQKTKQLQVKIQPATNQINQAFQVSSAIYRTYSIGQFGFYNSDCPNMMPKGGLIAASFIDSTGQPLNLNNFDITLIQLKPSKIMFDYHHGSCCQFKFNPNGTNMLFGVTSNGKLAYFTAEDFKGVKKSGSYAFKMRIYPKEIKSSDDIDELLAAE